MKNLWDKVIGYVKSPSFYLSVIVIFCAIALIILIRKIVRRMKENAQKSNVSTIKVISDIIKFFVVFGAVLLILQANGVNVTSLFAGLGIASAIIGLALQDVLKDIIMGIHITRDHFYAIGDGIEYEGQRGVICGFNLRTTKMQLIDKSHIVSVCNRNIEKVMKLTDLFDIDVPLSYNEDVKKVYEVMGDVADDVKRIPGVTNAVFKGTESFNDSSISYKLRISADPYHQPDVKRAANKIIQDRLAEANITIPFNQLDVHLDGGLNG